MKNRSLNGNIYLELRFKYLFCGETNFQGIYRAVVKVDGKMKSGSSTFFPKEWTPQQVVDAINEAFGNSKPEEGYNILYKGTSKSGIEIQMYITNGKIMSAYPLY